jgi:hypothetical protein
MRIPIIFLRIIFGITSIPLFFMLTGCSNYYKAANMNKNVVTENLNAPELANRYFILRNGANAYHMQNLVVSEDKKSITCHLDSLPANHTLHLVKGRGGAMRYKKTSVEVDVLNEVHFYIPFDTLAKADSDYVLSLDKVQKIEVLEKDKGKTTTSYILGGLAVTIGVIAVAAAIAAATKSSCPFVSAYNGKEMVLQGEIYGGAIYPQLCRHDYLKLNMAPAPNGKLRLQISNELKEEQFTDIADLLVVTHDKNVTIVPDEQGYLYSISTPVLPLSATTGDRDVMPFIAKQNDGLSYNFDDTLAVKENKINLSLSFARPANATHAKLYLRLKNSYWLDVAYGKFTEAFGTYYPTFVKEQLSKPAEEMKRWTNEQSLPLQVSLYTMKGWQTQQLLTTFGPVATREIVVPFDVSNIKDSLIHVQLSSGFMFWEIDYVAIDFSNNAAMQVIILQPENAKDETGANVLPLIKKEDGNYLQQPIPGNIAIIEYRYNAIKDSSKTQTFILHAKGYYQYVRHFTNTADMNFLMKFKQPGALSNYSMELYKRAMNTDEKTVVEK